MDLCPILAIRCGANPSASTCRLICKQMWFETPEASELLHKNASHEVCHVQSLLTQRACSSSSSSYRHSRKPANDCHCQARNAQKGRSPIISHGRTSACYKASSAKQSKHGRRESRPSRRRAKQMIRWASLLSCTTSAYNHRRSCTSTLILSVKAACTIRSTTIGIAGSASTKSRVRQRIAYDYSRS